ncbi:hypothetical protein BLOT_005709 [Blomia tropicalis]|nr:hypothetical protein BLOT_005709 [Blomia tropicalis]
MDHGKRKLSWKTVGSDIRSKVTIIIIKDSDSDKASTVSLMRLKEKEEDKINLKHILSELEKT